MPGARVSLDALVGNGLTNTVYTWKVDNQIRSDLTGAEVKIIFDNPDSSHIVEVKGTQGNQSATAKVTINVSMPEMKEIDKPNFKIPQGFSAKEQPPHMTDAQNLCDESIIAFKLGCPVSGRSNIPENSGIYFKTRVVPPSDFISEGGDSHIRFVQVVKPDRQKITTHSSGIEHKECLTYPSQSSPDGWRLDGAEPYGFDQPFKNEETSEGDEMEVLGQADDNPAEGIDDPQETKLLVGDKFIMYLLYYVKIGVQSENQRHAIGKLDWDWGGTVTKSGSTWIVNSKNPNNKKDLTGQKVQYIANSDGMIAHSGNVSGQGWTTCNSPAPALSLLTPPKQVAVWRKNNGVWYVMNADGTMQSATGFGSANDIPVIGDYDGDGKADLAVFRPDDPATTTDECQNGCVWYVLKSSDNTVLYYNWGLSTDKPVAADYDGDGKTDIAVWRPSDGVWYIIKSSDNSNLFTQYGTNGDVPVPSDYDGDGFDDLALWSPATASWKIFKSSTQTATVTQWGTSADKPVIGDYDGDGKTDIANFDANGDWHILFSSNSQTRNIHFGQSSDIPVPGDYDGDGKTDIAVYRPNGTQAAVWYILNSSNGQVQYQYWGTGDDIPIPAAYTR